LNKNNNLSTKIYSNERSPSRATVDAAPFELSLELVSTRQTRNSQKPSSVIAAIFLKSFRFVRKSLDLQAPLCGPFHTHTHTLSASPSPSPLFSLPLSPSLYLSLYLPPDLALHLSFHKPPWFLGSLPSRFLIMIAVTAPHHYL
jgi:hypothetical protein